MRKYGLVCIYILEILERHSSSLHRLSQEQIIHYLDIDYNLQLSRKTISGYLSELRADGYIAGSRGVYRVNKLSDNELRLLIDGVLFGQHIPQKDAEQLIEKLKSFSCISLKSKIKNVCYLEDINHTSNDSLYNILDIIDEAINRNCKMEITYCGYESDGKLHNWEKQIVNPYYIVAEKSRYYLICYAGRNDILENRRLDRISDVKILKEKRKPLETFPQYAHGFNLGLYMKEHIYMFSGKSVPVKMRIQKKRIGDFIDWYGNQYRILTEDTDHIILRIMANENAVYYWALQYGGIAEVLEPLELRNKIIRGLKDMIRQYEDSD